MRIKLYCQGLFMMVIGVISLMILFFNLWTQPKFLIGQIAVRNFDLEMNAEGAQTSCYYQLQWQNPNWSALQIRNNIQEINMFDLHDPKAINKINFEIETNKTLISTMKQTDCQWTKKLITINVGQESFWNYLHSHLVIGQ